MKAILFGPFVGELYWECGRFAPMLPFYKFLKYKNQHIKYIILTREERFDLYGKNADILIPLRIDGDYDERQPNCFRLNNFPRNEYHHIAKKFKDTYSEKYDIVEHIYPEVTKKQYVNKKQFNQSDMIFKFKPRNKNIILVENYIPSNKPIVILAPRFRKGFKRNWKRWPEFYDKLANDKVLMDNYNFIICGKKGEYIPDEKKRFYDMNDIQLEGSNTSLVGLLLVLMERAYFVFGSQSALPNIALLYKIPVLEFGCQRRYHTKSYNYFNTPITFIDDKKYNIEVERIFKEFKKLLRKKRRKNND